LFNIFFLNDVGDVCSLGFNCVVVGHDSITGYWFLVLSSLVFNNFSFNRVNFLSGNIFEFSDSDNSVDWNLFNILSGLIIDLDSLVGDNFIMNNGFVFSHCCVVGNVFDSWFSLNGGLLDNSLPN
jgi:hypothetical protein